MIRLRAGAVAAMMLGAAFAAADGGTVRLRQDSGPFSITLFTAPEPLRVGAADLSVLVQDRSGGEVLLDARVEIGLRGPGGRALGNFVAGVGRNRILKAVAVELPEPGDWRLEVVVRRGAASASVACDIPVGQAATGPGRVWPYLALTPLAVALFALRSRIRRR